MKYLSLVLSLFYAIMVIFLIFGYKPSKIELIAVYTIVVLNFFTFYSQESKNNEN